MNSLKVLLAEDSEDDALLLVRQLKRGDWDLFYQRVDSREAMSEALQNEQWDLIITDHNMPQFDSNEALELVKESGLDIPFLIVSGIIGEELAVAAMKSGAHDYIMKDNLTRLVPAVERELREAEYRRDHRKTEDAIHHMAYHDSLTNLVNRNEFERCLKLALSQVHEGSPSHVLLYLDLDQFKIINDTCGHIAGDELLRQVAVLLYEQVRERDTLARLGGDEFGVLLYRCPLDRAHHIAETLRLSIKNFRFVWQEKVFSIGVSIGLTAINADSQSVENILINADMACYAAKDLGRNRIHLYTDDDTELAQRRGEMQWVQRINQALEEDNFILYQQAILPLGANIQNLDAAEQIPQIQHNEFLVRMRDGTNDLISPGAFIPAAERYNLMSALDRWVIQAAFRHLGSQEKERENNVSFINLSGASLCDDKLFQFIRQLLLEYSIVPETICFEVTETAAIANLGRAVEFIREIKDLGCHFALDDFGSGMSSFSYLKTIPVDFLKIDGGFVKNMLNDAMDHAIVEVINQIGHVAGLKTIAEFVEDNPTRDRLTSIGVDYVQGYGIERPKPLVLGACRT